MENCHRNAIQKNFTHLVKKCNIDALLPHLVQKNVFTSEMVYKYVDQRDLLTRKRDLFHDIQRRGPDAFTHLIEALHAIGQHNLALDLDPLSQQMLNSKNGHGKKHAFPFQLPMNEEAQIHNADHIQAIGSHHYGDYINLRTEPLHVRVRPATQLYGGDIGSEVPVYSTHSKNRGAVLIINNIEYINDVEPYRSGADWDSNTMTELFKQMAMNVECTSNLTAKEMEHKIAAFASSPTLIDVDVSILVIMGHGRESENVTNVVGTDGINVSTLWIENQFSNILCPAMHHKPKIIIYQVCRGVNKDRGVNIRIQTDSAASFAIREKSDLLIAHSTLPGFSSHRDIFIGTWYIQLFCEMCMHHAHDKHVSDILTMVDVKLAALRSEGCTMQTSTFTNQGFQRCYFNPGIYQEDGEIKYFNVNM